VCTDRLTEQHDHLIQGRGSVHRPTGEGYCVQTDSQSNINTKPMGGVLCTDILRATKLVRQVMINAHSPNSIVCFII
jgi:hypothetical protein